MKKNVNILVLGDYATQFLCDETKKVFEENSCQVNLFEADFNQIERIVFDPTSLIAECDWDIVYISISSYQFFKKFNKLEYEYKKDFSKESVGWVEGLIRAINTNSKCRTIVINNLSLINDGVFGNAGNTIQESFVYQCRKFNFSLGEILSSYTNVSVIPVDMIQCKLGDEEFSDLRFQDSSSMPFTLGALTHMAKCVYDIWRVSIGNVKKCIILDLDNTTWGGIIGDDGIEKIEVGEYGGGNAFSRLQNYVLGLKQRGILVAVCSKNNHEVACQPFINHPEMILKMDDIAVFVANWNPKSENLKIIQKQLNIGFDSMVFVDDNKFEREEVKRAIPDIVVPDIPDDPTYYHQFLADSNYFECGKISKEDRERTTLIKKEINRQELQNSFANADDFLRSINMVLTIEPINEFNRPRVIQLSQRSNQFNLRTLRYDEEYIKNKSSRSDVFFLIASLKDDFGDHGIISVVECSIENGTSTLFIDNWFMSCRVLKRNVENAMLLRLTEIAAKSECKRIKGEYIPSPKNDLVKDHYQNLGFVDVGSNFWEISSNDYGSLKTNFHMEIVKK